MHRAVGWYRFLPYLPFLAYLSRGEPGQGWMRTDVFLSGLLNAEGELHRQVLSRAGADVLIDAAAENSVSARWLDALWTRMPKRGAVAGIEGHAGLMRILPIVLEIHPGEIDAKGQAVDARVHEALLHIIHLHSNSLVILPAYLTLVAWNLHRLHAELVSRRVFEIGESYA